MNTIAVVAPGQMGASLALCIKQANPSIRLVTDASNRSSRTRQLAEQHGYEDLGSLDAVLSTAEVALSVLVPDKALEFAQQVAEQARIVHDEGRLKTRFFADLNAVAPSTVQRAAAAFEGLPISFVDGSILGGPAKKDFSPPIALSGPRAEELNAFLHPLFLGRTKVVSDQIGGASALKMSFAALTKGLTGLAVNAALLAEKNGVTDALQEQLGEERPYILSVLQKMVPAATAKAFRWAGEMEEISAAYSDAGLPAAAQIYEGLAGTQNLIAKSKLGEEAIEDNLRAVQEGRTIADVVKVLNEGRKE
ncbi:hypothetical protein JCM6882_009224 [Rhodosporidiobolus microsporus]